MEKYSAYRDPGTGIQPFLPPVPPQGSGSTALLLYPLCFALGVVRTILVVLLATLYLLLQGLLRVLVPITTLYNVLSHALVATLARITLFVVGVYWINVEVVKRKRGRIAIKEAWVPSPGDVIISNWISWLELAWLAFRFNPIFALPVTTAVHQPDTVATSPSRVTPGRKTGTGSAAVSTPQQNRIATKRADILGFAEVSLLGMISSCGRIPPYGRKNIDTPYQKSFEQLQTMAKQAGRPLAIFPECTTSNGRGLLRFAELFKGVQVPVKNFKTFIMCVRIDPPTALSPTVSHTMPSTLFNPISHVFSISSSVLPHTLSIRLLAPSESPSSGTFVVSDVLNPATPSFEAFPEICAVLMSEIGRLKRMSLGWEDKASFFDFYKKKSG